VAAGLVVGIFPEPNAKALEAALSAQQIDPSKVKVFSAGGDDADESTLHFVDVIQEADAEYEDMTRDTGVLPDMGGPAVPGITTPNAPLRSFVSVGTSQHYLDGYEILDDEVDNFDDAISEGRAVVLYADAGADAPKIEAAFKAAGLQNVRTY